MRYLRPTILPTRPASVTCRCTRSRCRQVDSSLAYFAYYAGGFRVVRIVDDELVEVGHFIDEGGNNFWGVQLWQHGGKEYVLASDRDYGLYIFEYTGP